MATEMVVQSGPLRTFDAVFDNRFDKLKHVADYHTIQITPKPVTQRILINRLSRSADQEITFISEFYGAVGEGHKTVFGMRDVSASKGESLNKALWTPGAPKLPFHRAAYGTSDDDVVLVELKDFRTGFDFLRPHTPPAEGTMFFYLTPAPFDTLKIYWERACAASTKAKDDRFRRDILASAHESRITVWQDPDGSFGVLLHPKVTDVEAVEAALSEAGRKAGLVITFAPGLFS